MVKILFVCTGNICRSPAAEAMFRDYAHQAGKGDFYHIQSAGTHGYHVGNPPDPRGVKAAKARNISMQGLKAQKFSAADFDGYDLIIAMDQGHYDILENLAPPQAKAEIKLFMDYVEGLDFKDVPDPYCGDDQEFDDMLDLLELGMDNLFNQTSA